MTRRAPPLALIFVLLLTGLLPAAAAAADPPLPGSMAAVGDSITRAASTGGTLGADYPANSWSTGTNSTVNSHALRLQALGAQLTTHNLAVSGAKMANLDGQMANVVTVQPDYVTVLMGGNDLCTDTVAQMTSVADFRAQFATAMARLMSGTTDTVVYVVSIPNVYQLWNLFKGNFWARFIWSTADICQSLLANPTSTQSADVNRRETVRLRNIAYNAELKSVCGLYASRCRFDNEAAFSTAFTTSDVSGDYFHPSTAGQAKLASVSWGAGYRWATSPPANTPPAASFTHECTGLACAFADTSTDTDGTIASRSWSFGDGATSTATNPTRTYAAGGTYTVSLTVVDDDGASSNTTRSITVSALPANVAPTAAFTFSCSGLTCNFTDASTDTDGTIASRSWSFGDGATSTATNPSRTYAAGGTYTVTLSVTDDDGASGSTSQSVSVTAPEPPPDPEGTMTIGSLTGSSSSGKGPAWTATVTAGVVDEGDTGVSGAVVTGTWSSGGTSSCTTGADGSCSVTVSVNGKKALSTTFTVTGVVRDGYAYDPSGETSIIINR